MKAIIKCLFATILAVAVVSEAWASDPLLRKAPGAWIFGPRQVWTDGTTTFVFHPLGDPIEAGNIVSARISFQMSEIAGPCRIRPAVRFSNDATTWDAAVPVDTTNLDYITTAQVKYGTADIDISNLAGSTPRAWVQFGVQAANQSAGNLGFCNATVRVEPRRQ